MEASVLLWRARCSQKIAFVCCNGYIVHIQIPCLSDYWWLWMHCFYLRLSWLDKWLALSRFIFVHRWHHATGNDISFGWFGSSKRAIDVLVVISIIRLSRRLEWSLTIQRPKVGGPNVGWVLRVRRVIADRADWHLGQRILHSASQPRW